MRAAILAVLLVGCTATQPPATGRLDCNSCHASEYDNAPLAVSVCTMKPDHAALGYSRNCYECHGTTSPPPSPDPSRVLSGWCPADAKHTKFNIASGSHAGWDCANCHLQITYDPPAVTITTTPTNDITCISCHWHSQAQTDPRHLGKGDYTYGPATCLQCHPGGGRGG